MTDQRKLEDLSTQLKQLQDHEKDLIDQISNVTEQILSLQPDPTSIKFDNGLTLSVRNGASRIDSRKLMKLFPPSDDPHDPNNRLYKLAVDTKKARTLLGTGRLQSVMTHGANRVIVR